MFRSIRALGAFAVLSVVASAASAAVVYTGTTVGGPTWNRPVAGNPPTPPPSGVGTAVSYEAVEFTVDVSGSYVFQSTATSPANWDNFAFLYSPSFAPATPFVNVLVGNDDNPSIGLAGFTRTLTAGTPYVFVQTGFGNADAGAWSLDVTGPGNFVIPEPASLGLVSVGALALLRRRTAA